MGTPCNSPAHIILNHKPPTDQILNLPAVTEVIPLPDSSPLSSPLTSSWSLQQRQVNDDLHPIIQIMREQELGKFMLNIAVAVTAAVLLSAGNIGKSSLEFFVAEFVPFGLMTGFMVIWTGILLRKISTRLANVVEQVGISLVLILLYALVASFLPKYFSWVLWLCACLSLVPLVLSMLSCPEQTSNRLLDNACVVDTN